ncbi:MAG: phage integrase N-terminal SAM-like domain-containing protein [Phycisphaerales bacterium]|nr:phage integrase N-terminal SAM-like domain-containing protein [Phycisphaerales bacterium]
MGRKRKAWLHAGSGKRIERGKRLPGYYARWSDYDLSGKRINRKQCFKKLADARRFVSRFNARLELEALGEIVAMSLHDACREYLNGCSHKAVDTQRKYSSTLERLIAVVGDLEVREIDGRDVDAFIRSVSRPQELKSGEIRPTSKSTVARHNRNLNAFFRWCVRRKYATANPLDSATHVPKQAERRNRPTLTIETVERIMKAMTREHHRIGVQVAATTGLDRGFVEHMIPEQIDFDLGIIRGTRAKSRKQFSVPLHVALQQLLRPLARQTSPGCRILSEMLPRRRNDVDWWNDACESAGVSGVQFRDLRAFATQFLMSAPGMTLADARDLLQHSSIVTTADHYHMPRPDVVQAISSIPLPGAKASERKRSKAGKRKRAARRA